MRQFLQVLLLTVSASLHNLANAATIPTTRVYEYNARNQLESIVDSAQPQRNVSFTYDANGNRTTKTQGSVVTTYKWDARDRLIEVLRDGVWVAKYAYHPNGLRREKLLNGPNATGTRYQYDGSRLIAETNVIGNTVATYHYSAAGRLIGITRAGTTPQHFSYLLDGLGTPIALMAADGATVWRMRVDAWGNPVATVGSIVGSIGYTGYPIDDETGLFYANARYYDSELGAFLSEDPAQGDPMRPITLHPYVYGNGNPLIYLDRSGRTAELVEVLDGHGTNQAEIVALANQIKTMRQSATWYERPFVELGMVGTVVMTVGNRLGEGVIAGANAGANVVLNAADTYVVDLGAGADPSNAEIAEMADTTFAAAAGAIADPRGAANAAVDAAIQPYQKAYRGDTAAQLDLAASSDPRNVGKRVLNAMAPNRGPPKSDHFTATEGADGRPGMSQLGGPKVSMTDALSVSPSTIPHNPAPNRPPLGVTDPPQRYHGPWTERDLARAQIGQGPLDFVPMRNRLGQEMPLELHHADQMPGSAIHEVNPVEHRKPGVHGQPKQGVTAAMRTKDAQLHWQTRGQEMGNPPPKKEEN